MADIDAFEKDLIGNIEAVVLYGPTKFILLWRHL